MIHILPAKMVGISISLVRNKQIYEINIFRFNQLRVAIVLTLIYTIELKGYSRFEFIVYISIANILISPFINIDQDKSLLSEFGKDADDLLLTFRDLDFEDCYVINCQTEDCILFQRQPPQ